MGLTQKVDPETLDGGELLYCYRWKGPVLYRHYGVCVGRNEEGILMVIHVRDNRVRNNANPYVSCTSVDEFLGGYKCRQVLFSSSWLRTNCFLSGTNYQFSSLPKEVVISRAVREWELFQSLPDNVQVEYSLLFQNCEHFAMFCACGNMKSDQIVAYLDMGLGNIGHLLASAANGLSLIICSLPSRAFTVARVAATAGAISAGVTLADAASQLLCSAGIGAAIGFAIEAIAIIFRFAVGKFIEWRKRKLGDQFAGSFSDKLDRLGIGISGREFGKKLVVALGSAIGAFMGTFTLGLLGTIVNPVAGGVMGAVGSLLGFFLGRMCTKYMIDRLFVDAIPTFDESKSFVLHIARELGFDGALAA